MMKYAAIFAMALLVVEAQRPPYAGSSNRYPVVLPQYLEGREPAAASSTVDGIGNRIDAAPAAPTIRPEDLPVDALGDVELINRIKTWPRDKWPFWYLNWVQIQEHRGDKNNRGTATAPQLNTRSFFAGK